MSVTLAFVLGFFGGGFFGLLITVLWEDTK